MIECRGEFLAFLRRRLGSAAEAEDVLQDFYVRVLTGAPRLRNPGNPRRWLGRVLQTALADHYRRRSARLRAETAFQAAAPTAVVPVEEIDAAVCVCLYRLLPTLKPEYAEVLWRADLMGEPREHIAQSLAITANNVTVRLHRARRALEKRLRQTCLTCPIHGFLDCACDRARAVREAAEEKEARVHCKERAVPAS